MSECNSIADPCIASPQNEEEWSICLPWGARLWRDAHGVHVQPGNPPADGTYGNVIVADGCLVGVSPEALPIYEDAPCAPTPGACGGASTYSLPYLPEITPSVIPGNLFALDASGNPYAVCHIQQGDNTRVEGDGTAANPFIISTTLEAGLKAVQAQAGNSGIEVTGDGTSESILKISHKAGKQTTVDGLVFDAYGHLIDEVPVANKGIAGIAEGDGITVTTDQATRVATVTLADPMNPVQGNYDLGAYKVSVDAKGRLSAVNQQVDLGAEVTAQAGTKLLTINTFGSVTEVQELNTLGTLYALNFPASGGEATLRWAEFNLLFSTPLIGRLLCLSGQTFPGGLSVSLDDNPCDVQMLQDGSVLFWPSGIHLAGLHRLEILSGAEPWVEGSTFTALIFPANFATATGEE